MNEDVRVLLVGDETTLGKPLRAGLAEAEDHERFHLSTAPSIDAVTGALASGGCDVMVLCLTDTSERGVVSILELRGLAPQVPVVVLVEERDEPLAIKAVQLGAADYLVAERLYGTLVSRCLRHAVEVERIRVRLLEVEAQWRSAFDTDRGGERGGSASLRAALPKTFSELVGEYGEILDLAVEQVLYQVERPIEQRMEEVARRMGALWAGPRDVVEVHATALKKKKQQVGPQRMRLYTAEGRLRVLELMGRVLGYYRAVHLHRMRRTGN